MKKLEILNINIFENHPIISGVTKRNIEIGSNGFSISQASIYDENVVIEMKLLLAKNLNVEINSLIFQKQIHSEIINKIDSEIEALEGDAFISNKKGIILNVSIADCAAILVFDPINKSIAAIHSGWKGTKANIVEKTVSKMKQFYNSKSKDLICYISPCAGADVYEVEFDVAQYFPNNTLKINNTKYLFDNRKEIKQQLLNCGVLDNNIEVSEECTIKNTDYHSFRRDKKLSGRMSAYIGIQ